MFNPTEEQIETLQSIYGKHANSWKGIQYICDELIKMLNASPAHRVVEAPEGYEFHGESHPRFDPLGDRSRYFTLLLRPIPKPCPAPVLEPVTVTVEEIYGTLAENAKKQCATWEAAFGLVAELKAKGFTHAIAVTSDLPIWGIDEMTDRTHRICLRKWEPR